LQHKGAKRSNVRLATIEPSGTLNLGRGVTRATDCLHVYTRSREPICRIQAHLIWDAAYEIRLGEWQDTQAANFQRPVL
jgi:hypothetical protein